MTSSAPTPANSVRRPGPDETLIFLIRHAETAWNTERRFQGQTDVPLSEQGLEQAEALARWLDEQQVNVAAVYTSDLLRAGQTARPIAERLGLSSRRVTALREIHAGDWQGLLGHEIEELYPGQLDRWHREAVDFRLPGGETIPEVQARVIEWYRRTVQAHRGEVIIVVSHGLAIRSLLAALEGWEVTDTERMKQATTGNTGVTLLLADHVTGRSSLLFHNSLVHLEGALATEEPTQQTNQAAVV